MSDHTSKVAVVIGAAGGVGRATAEHFMRRGLVTVLADISPTVHETFEKLTEQTGASGGSALGLDVTNEEQVEQVTAQILDRHGQIDVLAVVAGINHEASPVAELTTDVWQGVFDVNLRGPFHLCRAVVPHMVEQGHGRIVTVASWWAHAGHAFFSAYCASKAALISLTQSMAAEVAASGVTVNAVCPGNVNTSMHTDALVAEAGKRGVTFEEMRDIEWAKIPMGRPGEPEQIAAAIAWLASDEASYITGASLDVNGGVTFH